MNIQDRVVVITGATGGLGKIAARFFGQAGYRLALFSTNLEKLNQLAHDLNLSQENYLIGSFDFREPDSAQQALQMTFERFGRVDILLHLMGGWTGGKPLPEIATDQLKTMLEQHTWSTFYILKAFTPHFVNNGWGRIIVISSPNASDPSAKSAPYSAGKAAQEALVLVQAQELKGTGVTANIIRVKAIDVNHDKWLNPTKENQSWATPEEITQMMAYLCTDEAGLLNGAKIPLYGSP